MSEKSERMKVWFWFSKEEEGTARLLQREILKEMR